MQIGLSKQEHTILQNLRIQLQQLSDKKTRETAYRFFKEPILVYGVKSATVQALAKATRKQIKDFDKQTIFWLCESLFHSDYCEESFIASSRTYELRKQYQPQDFTVFTRWIATYINNRAKCDTFCNHTMGEFIEQYPSYLTELKKRTKSKNRRVKRAAAVSLIIPAKKWKFLSDIFQIADALLLDPDDMVQKGYGRMLKVASQAHQQEVFAYVMKHKAIMPRTALRYAIEKMPKDMKVQAMSKIVE